MQMPLDIDFMPSYDRKSVIAEMRRIAALTGRNRITQHDFRNFGRMSAKTAALKFGSLEKAHEAAGLDGSHLKRFTDGELLKMLADLWIITSKEAARSPITADVAKYGLPICSRTFIERFGSWINALSAASQASYGRTVLPFVKPHRRKNISPRTRFFVFKRDLYTCRLCRRAGVELELDHIIPVSQGGSNNIDNLQALCAQCNKGKGGNLE